MQKVKIRNKAQDMKIPLAPLFSSLILFRLFGCFAFEINISINQVSPNGLIDVGNGVPNSEKFKILVLKLNLSFLSINHKNDEQD